ncbi:multidrug transporter [Paraburkholderia phytofirmans OLGA172]|uniref:Multidrug transporter n=1 Tax=Paraburkholderia phytofirmans OLGA172 TaxID=1417228 RepID=A0A167VWC1_9BURK|nr:FUSC family protein [Paraburkholderia phytofirmans]ANB72193.1 multidrug transporter [Paraburkholderia phytofirmans OLGA172]
MSAADYLPESLLLAGRYLRAELTSYPGRINVVLRCVLTSALVIVISMTLQVPLLALSLIVVFYVTQSNVVITRLIGIMFMVGSTLAISSAILLLKFTFDYPMIRIIVASALFFCSVYLIRITKIGIVFFIVAIVIIYVQSFVDVTDDAELLTRSVLWVWVAVNYAIVLTLLINTLLLPAEPRHQLKEEIHRQLAAIDARLAWLIDGGEKPAPIPPATFQQGVLTLQKLLRFAVMRDAQYRANEAHQLACIATVSRLYRAAGELPVTLLSRPATPVGMLRELRENCRILGDAIVAERPFHTLPGSIPGQGATVFAIAQLDEMQRALEAFSNLGVRATSPDAPKVKEPMIALDAFNNPVYVRFALKTLFAVLICYIFYNAADWQGIHTIMLTCLIMALPSLGASAQRGMLRVGGALVGSAIALFMVVFVIPHLDDIVGLLLMSLPVIALGSWISAGSERSSYAGIQIMFTFTFALALLEHFRPSTNLTEIRDRMVGILLGVGVSTLIQMAIWPEGEGDALRLKLADMLRVVAVLLRPHPDDMAAPDHLSYAQQHLRGWAALADCESVLARVALEPGWHEGEDEHMTLRAQAVLAQGREIMLAGNAFHIEVSAQAARLSNEVREAARVVQERAAAELNRYADDLVSSPPAALAPQRIALDVLEGNVSTGVDDDLAEREWASALILRAGRNLVRQLTGLPEWHVPEPVSVGVHKSHEHE